MQIQIKVQHLASVKEIEISLRDTLGTLKKKIEEVYAIPTAHQALMLENRNISTSTKPLSELGLKEGSVVTVKRIHQFQGQSKQMDVSSLLKNPMVKNMMGNPEMMNQIKEMFPDLKVSIEENKTLSMMLNEGGLEDEMERMAADSDYMSTQLRNADVTMAKLENIPGGINMMSGMLKDMEDPFRLLSSGPKLAGGNSISEKMTQSLPGRNKRNLLVEYRKELRELKDLGFTDARKNIKILEYANGDLETALEILLQEQEE
ncbi:hypothetical protein ENBRE01_1541 [Enteropsectra breve]|nr:hypothetical protein ENBRE01_1541 [Enteropsectra breve]